MFHHAFSLLYKLIWLLYINKVQCISFYKKKNFIWARHQPFIPLFNLLATLSLFRGKKNYVRTSGYSLEYWFGNLVHAWMVILESMIHRWDFYFYFYLFFILSSRLSTKIVHISIKTQTPNIFAYLTSFKPKVSKTLNFYFITCYYC